MTAPMRKPVPPPAQPVRFLKGRGAGSNANSRFDAWRRERDAPESHAAGGDASDGHTPDGVASDSDAHRPRTEVSEIDARSIISRNDSPDIGFDQSINPYQGCEHGCVYCYARPTHAWLGLSPGLDFETRLFAKRNAAALLRRELAAPRYRAARIALGANTDPYQPIERRLRITRAVLEVLSACRLPVSITTKSALVTRDIDLLAPMAARGLVRVDISIATLDTTLARTLEPRANSPARRLAAIGELAAAGIPVGVFTSPVIPVINDAEIEDLLRAAAGVGASHAGYVILRLPLEVRDLFVQWLETHFPLRAAHVMNRIRDMRGGRDYDADYALRMKGSGLYAGLIAQRFRLAARRLSLATDRWEPDASQFRRPVAAGDAAQLDLFAG